MVEPPLLPLGLVPSSMVVDGAAMEMDLDVTVMNEIVGSKVCLEGG
jgi:hypothetical protein